MCRAFIAHISPFIALHLILINEKVIFAKFEISAVRRILCFNQQKTTLKQNKTLFCRVFMACLEH